MSHSGSPATDDAALRSMRARIGAYSLHAQRDARETTSAARAAFLSRFLAGIPEDLPEGERLRRAEAARRAHFQRLAYRSALARRAKRRNGGGA